MQGQNRSGHNSKRPLVVLAGRSNVGKSSLIRALTGKRVRIGKRPGSTRWELKIDLGPVTPLDIPGFGHMSKQSKTAIDEMKTLLVRKLEDWSEQLALVILVIDISLFRELFDRWDKRREIPIDVELYSFLSEISPNVIVVANKIDKLKKRQQSQEIEYLIMRLKEAITDIEPPVISTSAQKGLGIQELKRTVEELLITGGYGTPRW